MAWDSNLKTSDRTRAQFALSHLRMAHDLRKIGDNTGADRVELAARLELVLLLDAEPDTLRGEVFQ